MSSFIDLLRWKRESHLFAGNTISKTYSNYIKNISPDYMALSFETIKFLIELLPQLDPQRILDYGSGISSFVLRYLRPTTPVYSVDDSEEWLNTTIRFLALNGILTHPNEMLTEDQFQSREQPRTLKWDFVLYDYSVTKNRIPHLNELKKLNCKTILFDDFHKKALRKSIYEIFSDDFVIYNLRRLTTDKFGRYCAVAIRKED